MWSKGTSPKDLLLRSNGLLYLIEHGLLLSIVKQHYGTPDLVSIGQSVIKDVWDRMTREDKYRFRTSVSEVVGDGPEDDNLKILGILASFLRIVFVPKRKPRIVL